MKYLSLIILLLTSCINPPSKAQQKQQEKNRAETMSENVEIFKYSNCEYIYIPHGLHTYKQGFMAHKGDCSNPIHEYKFQFVPQN